VKVRAYGATKRPIWVFEALENFKPLDGVFTTEAPHACEIEIHDENWDVFAEAVIRPMHLHFAPMTDDHLKSRIIDRIRALSIFDQEDELVAHSVTLRICEVK